MIRKNTLILAIFILLVSKVFGQNYEPLDLAKKIFSTVAFHSIKKYCTGEYQGLPNGNDFKKSTLMKFTILGQTEKTAVIGMTVLSSKGKGKGFDAYLHFKKDTIWKMNAYRALAMTGTIELMVKGLEKMTPKQIEKLIEVGKTLKENEGMINSKEDYDFKLGNAKLTIALDENIANHFLKNQEAFERIKNLALIQLETKKVEDASGIKLVDNIKEDYRKLFISSISTGGYELGNVITFLIGGILDNSVGYIYTKNKKNLPEMNADNIIMIKEIGNGWYIYKTT
jgi:hypothetical protein